MLMVSNELLKSMTTTYFIFIDFYKQVQAMGNHIICSSHEWPLSVQLENILSKQIQLIRTVKDSERISTIDFELDKIQLWVDQNTEYFKSWEEQHVKSFITKISGDMVREEYDIFNADYNLNKELDFDQSRIFTNSQAQWYVFPSSKY